MNEDKQAELVRQACKALGIAKEYVFAAKVYDDRVVVVTVGSHKGIYYPGKETEPMPEYKVTGKGFPPPPPKK